MLKKLLSIFLLSVFVFSSTISSGVYAEGSNTKDSAGNKTVNGISSNKYKDISKLKFGESTLYDVIKVFGEPDDYFASGKLSKDNLPSSYIANYNMGLQVLISNSKLYFIMVNNDDIYYGSIHVGTSFEDFVKIEKPLKIEEKGTYKGESLPAFTQKVLYKYDDYNGRKGYGYYCILEKGIEIWFENNKVSEIDIEQPYNNANVFKTLLSSKNKLSIVRTPPAAYYSFSRPKATKLPVYNPNSGQSWQVDIRSSDLTGLDLKDRLNDLLYADFDSQTKWPEKLPEGFNPQSIMELGKNPGLGVRNLTQKGFTGKNIGIAIIDDTLMVDHEEYKDRLKLYEEMHCMGAQSSMHGPAVASIAAGKTVGVATEADLYYIATTYGTYEEKGFEYDLDYLAKAIDRVIEINKTLSKNKKIRVISISLGINNQLKGYDKAIQSIKKAEKEGIYTVYVGSEAFGGLGRDTLKNPDDISSFSKGKYWSNYPYDNCELLVPMDSRCTASPTGPNDYVLYSSGGMSWAVPYVAGLYALACQANPEITPDVFWKEAFRTSDTIQVDNNGNKDLFGKIVNPQKLIESIKNIK